MSPIIKEDSVNQGLIYWDSLQEACESNGVQFMDGSMWLHHPRTAKMKDLLSNFGQLNFVSFLPFNSSFV